VFDEEERDAKDEVSVASLKDPGFWAQVASTFGLVFAAEFGDRSFLATIALGASQDPLGVASGAIAGHAVATTIAVLGGGSLAKYVSEKFVGILSGSLFLVFALTTLVPLIFP